ncbi:MAG: LysR family transcriptional regulator [Lachnospiraceae bacterium]
MKLLDMELFLQIVQEESLNRTAEKNYMSEAAVSQAVKENGTGTGEQPVLQKKGRKLELTDAG